MNNVTPGTVILLNGSVFVRIEDVPSRPCDECGGSTYNFSDFYRDIHICPARLRGAKLADFVAFKQTTTFASVIKHFSKRFNF